MRIKLQLSLLKGCRPSFTINKTDKVCRVSGRSNTARGFPVPFRARVSVGAVLNRLTGHPGRIWQMLPEYAVATHSEI